jgi:MATE family multidrug resistance protein
MYASTFVAQYVGAGRKERVGPAVWQALHFALISGLGFLMLVPLVRPFVALTGHGAELQGLEVQYLECLCFATLPFLIVASTNSFFSGRGETWRVLMTDGTGAAIAVVLCYAWIDGRWGFPAMGIRGAGWALVGGTWCAAAVGLTMFLLPRYRREFNTLAGWRLDPELFRRMMRFGVPNGMQYCFEALAFAIFLVLVGRLGTAEIGATSIVFTINMVALVPMVGLAQAVSVLVGQRLGQNRPDIAAKTVARGVAWCLGYTIAAALIFVSAPRLLARQFGDPDPERWAAVEPLIPLLLKFVAVYCLFESVSLILSFALRGAGDTRFVSAVTLVFSWLVMVVPTILASRAGWGLTWVWVFATSYLVLLSLVLTARYRQGKWRTMRVIESTPEAPAVASPALALDG